MTDAPLFRLYNIFDVIESRKVDLKERIKRLPDGALRGDVHEVAKELAKEYLLNVPVLHEDKKYMTQQEVEIDVGGDPMSRFTLGNLDGGPIYVNATEVTVSIPFDGDSGLFNVQPSTFSTSPPRGYASDHELKLTFVVRQGGPNLKEQYDETIRGVHEHLRWLSESISQLPAKLVEEAVPAIVRRKSDLDARAAAVNSLGIPVRHQGEPAVEPSQTSRSSAAPSNDAGVQTRPQWDVFVSHAGEDKDEIARPLAEALEAAGLAVWFDEKSLQLGDSLREKIDQGLARSTYGVVILSKHFFEKHWPQQELNGMASREVDGRKVILPVWHNIEANEVRGYSPILADRMAVSTAKGIKEVVKQIVAVVKPSLLGK